MQNKNELQQNELQNEEDLQNENENNLQGKNRNNFQNENENNLQNETCIIHQVSPS